MPRTSRIDELKQSMDGFRNLRATLKRTNVYERDRKERDQVIDEMGELELVAYALYLERSKYG